MRYFEYIYIYIVAFCHIFINYRIVSIAKGLKKRIYSEWIKHEFGECGNKCKFEGFKWLNEPRLMRFGSNINIGSDVIIELYKSYGGQKFNPIFVMGNYSSFGDSGHISCVNKVTIGNNVRIGKKVFITDNSHGSSDRSLLDIRPNLRPIYSKGAVIIKDNAWIGEMVCIMPGVTIGRGSIIGANSVVTHDVPDYCVAAGNPARIIKDLR